jgi:hypothetical protein
MHLMTPIILLNDNSGSQRRHHVRPKGQGNPTLIGENQSKKRKDPDYLLLIKIFERLRFIDLNMCTQRILDHNCYKISILESNWYLNKIRSDFKITIAHILQRTWTTWTLIHI